jgi:hypothetical protein
MAEMVVLDNKRRGSFGPEFKPGDSFVREIKGETVVFRRLQVVEPPLVRARKIRGKWMGAGIKQSRQGIIDSIREDREQR